MSKRRHPYATHIGLFVVTCVTTTFVGLAYVGPAPPDFLLGAAGLEPGGLDWSHWWRGLAFSATLMGILLCHEFGHFIAARRHGVDVSLPYFIPFPIGLGTLGALISMREKVRNRNALVDIGAAGPLAGLIVAIGLLVVGLWLSDVSEVPPGTAYATEGNSLLYLGLKLLVFGEILPGDGRDVFLHPVAWAAWCGLLVTMINLIPVGQLDGGHISFALFGNRYTEVSRRLHQILPLAGLIVFGYVFFDELYRAARVPELLEPLWLGLPDRSGADINLLWLNTPVDAAISAATAALPWFIWPLLLLLLRRASGGRYHPRVELAPLSRGRRALGILVLVVFILIFTPIPLRSG